MVPFTSSNSLIISETRACRPRYWTRSVMALGKDHTIASHNVAAVWFCITLFTSKTHCSNETSPFWMGSPLKVLNFGILPTTCEVTQGQEFSSCGTDVGHDNCILMPSPRVFSFLSTHHSSSPNIICSSMAMSHSVCTLWPNHTSIDCTFWHNFSIISPSAKFNKVFLSSTLWTTTGSTVICSYNNPMTLPWSVNTGDNGCPLSNSVVKITTLLPLTPIEIGSILSVNDVDIVPCLKLGPR